MSDISVDVEVPGEGEECHSVPEGSSILELMDELGHNPETVVVKRDGKIVAEEEELEDGDEIEIVPIVSGG